MDNYFNTSFGFTEEEVKKVLKDFELIENIEEVKKWYDGYKVGKVEDVYNPWSIINYAKNKELIPYWVNTSSNDIVRMILQNSSCVKEKLEKMLKGEEVEVAVNFDTVLSRN